MVSPINFCTFTATKSSIAPLTLYLECYRGIFRGNFLQILSPRARLVGSPQPHVKKGFAIWPWFTRLLVFAVSSPIQTRTSSVRLILAVKSFRQQLYLPAALDSMPVILIAIFMSRLVPDRRLAEESLTPTKRGRGRTGVKSLHGTTFPTWSQHW